MTFRIAFAAACAGLPGALSWAAPVPKDPKPAAIYFPTAVGAKWVYERGDGTLESVVVSAVEKDGADLVVSREAVDGTTVVYAKVVVSAEGLRQKRERTGETDWVLKAAVKPGTSWDMGEDGKRTVHGPEEVEVPAGKYRALRVEWASGETAYTSWYAPGVGEVKRVSKLEGETTVRRVLKSFEAKAASKSANDPG